MAFLETPRFPDNISYGVVGGPMWITDIVTRSSGHEQRIGRWAAPLWRYPDVAHAARLVSQLDTLEAFFLNVGGRLDGFRFKDWADYQATTSNGILGSGIGTGLPTYQLIKKYVTGARSFSRTISKPVTVSLYRNGSPVTAGVAAGNYAVDTVTGIITFVADSTKNINANSAKAITGLSQANPGNVLCVGHGFSTGDKIKLTSVGGMTQVNNLYFTITVVDADNFTIGVNTSAYTAYTSGGTATKYGITQTNPARVYATAHGFNNGDVVYLTAAAGMTAVNNLAFTVANKGTDYFDLSGIDATAYSAYTGSGVASKYPQAADTLTWAGEFDVPVRFDTDMMNRQIIAPGIDGWGSIPLVEIRL